MIMPNISIVIPVYNVEKYLNRCIDSIIAQTFTDWECILVDDGSPDNCGKICDDYAKNDSRIKVIHQINMGLAGARNSGLKIATGKYVVFLDSDDYVSTKWIENLLYEKEKHPNSIIFGNLKKVYYKNDYLYKEISSDIQCKEYSFADLILSHVPLFACSRLFNREEISLNHIKFPTDVTVEDLPFVLSYLSHSKEDSVFLSSFDDYYYVQDERETLSRKYYKNSFTKRQEKYRTLYYFIDTVIPNEQKRLIKQTVSKEYVYYFLNSLTNTYDKRNSDSFFKKLHQNYKIITSSEFQRCLKDSEINEKGYIWFLRKKMNIAAIIYERLSALKNFLR